ncbi:hypothetical protein [Halovivax limisalsi]|uniref:hypothetical protein n=1 Tax=Halovivax limisalsi TaxID=1453760 RepID=UPI001FFCB605|nr:hypothetical protein [Halovivax limisalsi]
MVISKLLGSKATRSLTVVSALNQARRALQRGRRLRAAAYLGLAVLAWKWTVISLATQGILRVARGGTETQPS